MKKVGIIGSGIVGQTLYKGFTKHAYEVMIGTEDYSKHALLQEKLNNNAQIGNFESTAAFGDLLVLAVKGSVAEKVINGLPKNSLKNKVIIDATNPISDEPPVHGVLSFFTTPNKSLMETLQNNSPEAKFVKAFNSIGSAFMVNPEFSEGKPSMFYCGNDEKAKSEVRNILSQFGFEPEDMGMAEAARAIENLCILWCIPGFNNNSWSHAFKLLKK